MTSERPPESVGATLREAGTLLRRCVSQCLLFGSLYQVVAGVILTPFVVWLADAALAIDGDTAVLNFDIASLATSLVGVITLFAWSIGTALVVLLGLGGQVVITADAWRRGARPLRKVWRATLAAAPRLLQPAILKVGFYGLVLIPVITFVLGTIKAIAVGSEENLALTFLPEGFGGQVLFLAGLVLLALLCYWVLVRWTFILHALLLERRPLRDAMRRSVELVSKARAKTMWTIIALHLLVLLVGAIGSLIFQGLVWLCFTRIAPEPNATFVSVATLLLFGTAIVSILVTSLLGGYGAAVGTVLFKRLGGSIDPAAAPSDDAKSLVSMRAAVWAMVGLLAVAGALAAPDIADVFGQKFDPPRITAHRGSSGEGLAPENTMAAFQRAIDDKADYIELDVMEAKDGAIVVVHDVNLKRLAGVNRDVFDMTLPELQALDVGSHFDPKFSSERIPTLGDVIDLARGKLRLNIELKTHGREKDFPASVVRLIDAKSFRDECVVTSLDYGALRQVRQLDPEQRIGAIVTVAVGNVYGLDVDFYSVAQKRATPAFLRRAHARDQEVHAWTVNSAKNLRLMMDRGVDNIITDYPERALKLRDARTERDDLRGILVRLFDR